MNKKTKTLATLVAVVSTICLSFLGQTSAQSSDNRVRFGRRTNSAQSTLAPSPNSNCKQIKGFSVTVFDPITGIVSGPITNAGILNGPSEDVINFGAGFVFTPDPSVISYTSELTITTVDGQLKASTVTTQSVVTGVGAEWGHINPNTSTGRFAGATGQIFFSFKPVGDPAIGPYEADVTGEICFANQ